MLTTAFYFLQVILCSAVMMGYYWLVLRNKRFHQYNRFYLLSIAILSWVVPLIRIQWGRGLADDQQVIRFLSVVADNNSEIEATVHSGFRWSWDILAIGIYLSVAGFFLFLACRALLRLYGLMKTHSCKNLGDIYIILTHAKGTPFSFFRYIFWNEEIDIRSEAGKQILQHELTHVQQKHSIDKLFIQLLIVAGWFNPFFWLLRREMDMIHEFIADKKAVHNGDTASLAQMLLTAAYPQQKFALTHPFFFSPIKRRLQMLANNKNPRFTYLRRLIVLPLLAIVVVLFAFRNKEYRKYNAISVGAVVESIVNARDTVIIKDVPATASKNTSLKLKADKVISENRATDQLKNKLGNAPNKMLSLLVIGGRGDTIHSSGNILYIVNGEKAKDSNVLQILSPSDIQSVSVWKDESAISKYGEEGRNGVIEILTKNKSIESLQEKKYGRVFTQVQVPAEFPGGKIAWQKYLERNLNRDLPVQNGAPPGKYIVTVSFLVDQDGAVSDVKGETDPGYGTKDEAVRVIEKGPNWKPAIQNGKKVMSRNEKTITFVISAE